ncbi:MAG: hypothetical protein QRY71_06150 [Candidatus Rhabdochlamydia sp.]
MSYFKGLLIFPLTLTAFEQEPWPSNVYECQFTPSYVSSHYSKLSNALSEENIGSKNTLNSFNLLFTPAPNLQTDLHLEFAKTSLYAMGYQSAFFECRYQCLDDLISDPVALVTAVLLRNVSSKRLDDVSCPYSAPLELEFSTVAGKEWSDRLERVVKLFGGINLGIGTLGSSWLKSFITFNGVTKRHQEFGLSLHYARGFGSEIEINPLHFHGYGPIKYQNIDLSLHTKYHIPIWGSFAINYGMRLYAKSCPQNLSFWQVSYTLPFSLF